jgi:hypothetical protein
LAVGEAVAVAVANAEGAWIAILVAPSGITDFRVYGKPLWIMIIAVVAAALWR